MDPEVDSGGPGFSASALLHRALTLRARTDRELVLNELAALVGRFPDDQVARVLYIQALGWSDRRAKALEQLGELLNGEGESSLENIQQLTLERLCMPDARIDSEYICFPGSMVQNLGFWIHRVHGQKEFVEAITKVMHVGHCGQEITFYEHLRPLASGLARLSPEPLHVIRSDQHPVVMLTMRKVGGEAADPDVMNVARFHEEYRDLAQIPYEMVRTHFGAKHTENGFSHGYLASSLHEMDTADGCSASVEWVRRAVSDRQYPAAVVRSVLEAAQFIERSGLHNLIDPQEHYSMLHGDMHRHNVLISNGRNTLLDWARCTTGPRGIDLAVLFRRFGHRRVLREAEEHVILAPGDTIPQVLLSWALIVVSLQIDLQGIKTEPPDHLFMPASKMIATGLA